VLSGCAHLAAPGGSRDCLPRCSDKDRGLRARKEGGPPVGVDHRWCGHYRQRRDGCGGGSSRCGDGANAVPQFRSRIRSQDGEARARRTRVTPWKTSQPRCAYELSTSSVRPTAHEVREFRRQPPMPDPSPTSSGITPTTFTASTSTAPAWPDEPDAEGLKKPLKLRVRFYDNHPEHQCFFEVKRRENDAIIKARARSAAMPPTISADRHSSPPERLGRRRQPTCLLRPRPTDASRVVGSQVGPCARWLNASVSPQRRSRTAARGAFASPVVERRRLGRPTARPGVAGVLSRGRHRGGPWPSPYDCVVLPPLHLKKHLVLGWFVVKAHPPA